MVQTGSILASDIPVMKAFLDMEANSEPEDIIDILYNPEVRKA